LGESGEIRNADGLRSSAKFQPVDLTTSIEKQPLFSLTEEKIISLSLSSNLVKNNGLGCCLRNWKSMKKRRKISRYTRGKTYFCGQMCKLEFDENT